MARAARASRPKASPRGLSPQKQAEIEHRVAGMTTQDIFAWMDSVGSGMAKAIMDYQKYRDLRSLDEMSKGLYTLQVMVGRLEEG